MKIPARDSVKTIGRWAIGSLYFCENYDSLDLVPDDALKSWKDDGAVMCLRPQAEPLTSASPGWSEHGRGLTSSSSCVWTIGVNTMVKALGWTEGVQLEGKTIKFINERHPEIPTTEVIYEWIDNAWDRTFMIMKRAPGTLLFEAWQYMTKSQKQDIADQIAVHIKTLARNTSSQIETVDGLGVVDIGYVTGCMPLKFVPIWPTWKPWRHPPFSRDAYIKHLRYEYGCTSFPDIGTEFVLYNPDIHASNIFVKWPEPGEKGELMQIIDWELTGYWPRFWVSTCPAVCHPFTKSVPGQPRSDWGELLHAALTRIGFTDEKQWLSEHISDFICLMNERAGPEYHKYLDDDRRERGVLQSANKLS